MPSASNGSGASPGAPDQPTQAPPASRITGSSAVTRPPGLGRHSVLAVRALDPVDRQPVGHHDEIVLGLPLCRHYVNHNRMR